MVRTCCVSTCCSGKNVPSHVFPKDIARRKLWLERLHLNQKVEVSEVEKLRVCYKHFHDTDYSCSPTRRVLKNTAIPSIQVEKDYNILIKQQQLNEQQQELKEQQQELREQQQDLKEQRQELREQQQDLKEQRQELREQQQELREERQEIKEQQQKLILEKHGELQTILQRQEQQEQIKNRKKNIKKNKT